MNIRVIPRLDIKGQNLVKGIHLEGLRVLGRPEEFARYYYENGADELLYMDVVASLYERNSLKDIISKTAKEIFIPLCVGGGLRTISDIQEVLRAGADKVCINTGAIKNPKLIREAANKFGSSTIVIAIEVSKQSDGKYLVYTDNGREFTGIEALTWMKQCEELGAGEFVITSIDRDGTGKGFDLDFIKKVENSVSVPLIVHGGCGQIDDVIQLVKSTQCSAVAISSCLHYKYVEQRETFQVPESEGNIEFLKKKGSVSYLSTFTIQQLKERMQMEKIACRTTH